jgi:hypothetical protein
MYLPRWFRVRSKQTTISWKTTSFRPVLELLEDRLTPTLLTLNTPTALPNGDIQVTGNVGAGDPEGYEIDLSGVVNGSTTTDSIGNFSFTASNVSFGEIDAHAWRGPTEAEDWESTFLVNQAPSFTANNPDPVEIGADPVTIPNWASFNPGAPNETWQTPTYTVSNISNPDIFLVPPSVDANGTLTYTVSDELSGTSTFDLQVQDNGGVAFGGCDTSDVQQITVAVQAVNARQVTNGNNAGQGSLRAAINAGNDPARGATDFLITFSGVTAVNLATPLPALNKNFNIVGPEGGVTINQGLISGRVFGISATSTTNISYVTLTGAKVPMADSGGAIRNLGNLTLSWIDISDFIVSAGGGAIYNTRTLNVFDCKIHDNRAYGLGGGILNDTGATAVVTNGTQINNNTAEAGGGIANGLNATLTISGISLIEFNHAIVGANPVTSNPGRGGGILNTGTLTATDVSITENDSVNEGGGIFIRNGPNSAATATFTNVIISFNMATGQQNGKGGGLYLMSGTARFDSGCSIDNNSAAANPNGNGAQVGATDTIFIMNGDLNTWDDSVFYE